jgi:hypothetical protein
VLFTERQPRKPPKAKEITITLTEGVLTFRKKDMSGRATERPKSTLVVDRTPMRILPGPAAPLEGIVAALTDSAAGLVVRHAIERGTVTWVPSPATVPRLSTKATRDPFVVDTKAVRETYRRIAAGLVMQIDEPALLAYLERVVSGKPLAPGITARNYHALSDHSTPELAPILGPFNGFSYLQTERLYPYLGFFEAWRAVPATEMQKDPNWCRVLQDLPGRPPKTVMYAQPELSFYAPHERPALAPVWVRPRYRATSSAVEAVALAMGIPALAATDLPLPALAFQVDALDGVLALRWICADGLTLVSDDGTVRQAVRLPLRVANHDDLVASFVAEQREWYQTAARSAGGQPIALHPVSPGALPAYVHTSDEAYAHALLDVACDDSDPGRLLTHLAAPVEEGYWYDYPIQDATFRATLVARAAAESPLAEAIAARIVATAARVAHLADEELAPLLETARQFGLSTSKLAEYDSVVAMLQSVASRASVVALLGPNDAETTQRATP